MRYLLSLRYPASESGNDLSAITPAYIDPEVDTSNWTATSSFTVQSSGGLRRTTYARDDSTHAVYLYGMPVLPTGWMRCWRSLVYQTSPRGYNQNQGLFNGVINDGHASAGDWRQVYSLIYDHSWLSRQHDSTGATITATNAWTSVDMNENNVDPYTCIYSGWVSANGAQLSMMEARVPQHSIVRHSQRAFCNAAYKTHLPTDRPCPFFGIHDRSVDGGNEVFFQAFDVWDIRDTSGLTL